MLRINTFNKATDLFGAGKHGYRAGNPATGQAPTECSPDAFNALQEEVASVVEGAGLALNASDNAQMLAAINLLIKTQMSGYVLDTGAANAYVVALTPAITAYTDGLQILIKIAHANTGASTINAGGGVVPLVNNLGAPFAAGDLQAGGVIEVMYVAAAAKFYVTSMVLSQTLSQAAADGRYAALADGVKPGMMFDFPGTSAPAGYLLVPTAATNISRATYAALYAAIGTTWGAGDGATTFGLPWVRADGVTLQASGNVGTQSAGSVGAHSHTVPSNLTGTVWLTSTVTGYSGIIPGTASATTGTTGGTSNLAAGSRFLKCIKY